MSWGEGGRGFLERKRKKKEGGIAVQIFKLVLYAALILWLVTGGEVEGKEEGGRGGVASRPISPLPWVLGHAEIRGGEKKKALERGK